MTHIHATPYANVNEILDLLLVRIQAILGAKLVGFYLFGSLVTGDFDSDTSDIDVLAATSSDIDEQEFDALQAMHADIASEHKEWNDRIEVAYLSVTALKTYKAHVSNIAIISPGEPFHVKEAGIDWLINWYTVREKGIALVGPSPGVLIEPISQQELRQAVRNQLRAWREWITHTRTRGGQAYAILTMCRALYTLKNGEIVSKKQSALWAMQELPAWSPLIQNALIWREAWRDENVDHDATLPETLRFVYFAIDQGEDIPL